MGTPDKTHRVLSLIPGLTAPPVLTDSDAVRCDAALNKLIDRIPREIEELRASLFAHRNSDFAARVQNLRELLLDCFASHLASECDYILKHFASGKYAICEAMTEKFSVGLLEFSLSAQTALFEAEQAEEESPRRDEAKLLELLDPLEERLREFNFDASIEALACLDAAGFGKEAAPIWTDVNNFKFPEARNRARKLRRSLSRSGNAGTSIRVDGGKPMLLAVDDRPAILAGLKGMLGEKYRFYAVTSGQAALKFLETRRPDVFIIDIEMPEMNGYELVAHIRERGQPGPIVFLTGNATREYVLKALSIGVTAFLVKPCREETLLAKLDGILHPPRRQGK